MKLVIAALLFAAVALAQGPVPIQPTAVAPSGNCPSPAMRYLMPGGSVYTCQNGTWAIASGAAITALTGGVTATGPGSATAKVIQVAETVTALVFGSSPYTVLSTDSTLTCDATGGAVVINLPAATGTFREITTKKIDSTANACTLTRSGADTIDGATTAALTVQYAASKIQDAATATWYRTHVNQLVGGVTGVSTANTIANIPATQYLIPVGNGTLGQLGISTTKLNGGIIYPTADSTTAIQINKADGTTNVVTVDTTNIRMGIGTASPTAPLSFTGQSAQTIWMERQTTGNTAGNNLTIQASGATVGASNKNGGTLTLSGGISTGTGAENGVVIQTYGTNGSPTVDNSVGTASFSSFSNNSTSLLFGPVNTQMNATIGMLSTTSGIAAPSLSIAGGSGGTAGGVLNLTGGGNNGNSQNNSPGGNIVISGGASGGTAAGGAIIFQTTAAGGVSNNTTNAQVEAMRITTATNALFGSSTELNYKLAVQKSGSSGTTYVGDRTATTGSTLVTVDAGQGQSGNVLEVRAWNATPGAGALKLQIDGNGLVTSATGFVATAVAPTVAPAQIGYGGTVAASSNCGSAILTTETGCIVINVAGTTRYIPYF